MIELNKNINSDTENFDTLVEELSMREEFSCTGDVCGAHADICIINLN